MKHDGVHETDDGRYVVVLRGKPVLLTYSKVDADKRFEDKRINIPVTDAIKEGNRNVSRAFRRLAQIAGKEKEYLATGIFQWGWLDANSEKS